MPKKKRYTTSACRSPVGLPLPYEPVPSVANRMMIMVEAKSDHLREK